MSNCKREDLRGEFSISDFWGLTEDGKMDISDYRDQSQAQSSEPDLISCENCEGSFTTFEEALKHLRA